MNFKITYSSVNANMDQIHELFDHAVLKARSETGREFMRSAGGSAIEKFNPADTSEKLGVFFQTPKEKLDGVYAQAFKAQKNWQRLDWRQRVDCIRRAAELISEDKFHLSAICTLEVGKNRMEALGEVEEAADLLRYYADQIESSDNFVKPMLRLNPKEATLGVLKPYGVFAVIAPFNFPVALAAGMAGAALLAGNAVVLKPSAHTPWSGELLRAIFQRAGLPDGVLQIIHGDGDLGAAMVRHPMSHGVAFTGSHSVGMEILKTPWRNFPRPILMELGGKNPVIVTESADLDVAVEGSFRSAFGLSGQKCSALSRIYVHKSRKTEFIERLITKTKNMVIGNPTEQRTYMGPVIHGPSLARYREILGASQSEGFLRYYDETLANREELRRGYFVSPIVAEVPHTHPLMRQEHFLPFVAIDSFENFSEAMLKANDSDYGLTAGIYSKNQTEVNDFMNSAEAGVLYANRSAGATTGAWPGVQPFCGWKGSGATGKGGCGPYYVAQFMREQSQTRMED